MSVLSAEDLTTYKAQSFLVLEEVFDAAETQALLTEVEARVADHPDQQFLDNDGKSIYICYAIHTFSEMLGHFVRLPRVLGPVHQLLGRPVYLHQSKFNPKRPFDASATPWHQDFSFWNKRDGIPTPDLINVAVFLDDITAANAPLIIFPGSQAEGLIPTDSTCLLSRDSLHLLAEAYPARAVLGKAGTIVLFGGLIAHGAGPNFGPYNRRIVYLTYNRVGNRSERTAQSPNHLAGAGDQELLPHADDQLIYQTATPNPRSKTVRDQT